MGGGLRVAEWENWEKDMGVEGRIGVVVAYTNRSIDLESSEMD